MLRCFNANAAPGLSRSRQGQGHAHPPWPHLREAAVPAAIAAPQQLLWHDRPVSALGPWKPTSCGHLLEPQTTSEMFTPHGSAWGSQEVSDSLAESLAWKCLRIGGIKLCSDTQILQNSENGWRIPTLKPKFEPLRAWARPRGVVNHHHPTDCPDRTQLEPQWGS